MDYKTITQELIDYLINLDKFFEDESIQAVTNGNKESFSLYSDDGRCFFSLDMNRSGEIEMKTTLQTRYLRTNDCLIRLDLNSPPHTNPDGSLSERDHIHILKEKDGILLNISYNLSTFNYILINNTRNIAEVFEKFCEFSNIKINHDLQTVI